METNLIIYSKMIKRNKTTLTKLENDSIKEQEHLYNNITKITI